MIRALIAASFCLTLISCTGDKPPPAAPPSTPPAATGPGAPAAPAKPAAEAVKTPADAKAAAEQALGGIQPAVAKDVEEVKVAAAGAVAQAQEVMTKAADSSVSVDSLKGILGSLKVDDLKALADKLLAGLNDNQGIVKGLQEQISKLGLADAAKIGELKRSLESATTLVTQLKEKLGAVVGKLKEHGIDVSKYTALLGGP